MNVENTQSVQWSHDVPDQDVAVRAAFLQTIGTLQEADWPLPLNIVGRNEPRHLIQSVCDEQRPHACLLHVAERLINKTRGGHSEGRVDAEIGHNGCRRR